MLGRNGVIEPLRAQDGCVAVRAVEKTHKSTKLPKSKKVLVLVSSAIVYQNMAF
jgi:hypothetical protein